jgi:CheY-like chemotaxis protein
MHGGTIEALSEGPGHGAEFVVRLPATGRAPMAADRPPAVADDGSKRKVLVADDNRDSADSLGMLLRLAGHDVEVAYDGSAAIAIANTLEPDVILLDIGMPKMNGYDAARNIRREAWSANTVLIALTGWGQTEDKLRAQQAGFDRHLVRPVDSAELAAALQATRDASLETPGHDRRPS